MTRAKREERYDEEYDGPPKGWSIGGNTGAWRKWVEEWLHRLYVGKPSRQLVRDLERQVKELVEANHEFRRRLDEADRQKPSIVQQMQPTKAEKLQWQIDQIQKQIGWPPGAKTEEPDQLNREYAGPAVPLYDRCMNMVDVTQHNFVEFRRRLDKLEHVTKPQPEEPSVFNRPWAGEIWKHYSTGGTVPIVSVDDGVVRFRRDGYADRTPISLEIGEFMRYYGLHLPADGVKAVPSDSEIKVGQVWKSRKDGDVIEVTAVDSKLVDYRRAETGNACWTRRCDFTNIFELFEEEPIKVGSRWMDKKTGDIVVVTDLGFDTETVRICGIKGPFHGSTGDISSDDLRAKATLMVEGEEGIKPDHIPEPPHLGQWWSRITNPDWVVEVLRVENDRVYATDHSSVGEVAYKLVRFLEDWTLTKRAPRPEETWVSTDDEGTHEVLVSEVSNGKVAFFWQEDTEIDWWSVSEFMQDFSFSSSGLGPRGGLGLGPDHVYDLKAATETEGMKPYKPEIGQLWEGKGITWRIDEINLPHCHIVLVRAKAGTATLESHKWMPWNSIQKMRCVGWFSNPEYVGKFPGRPPKMPCVHDKPPHPKVGQVWVAKPFEADEYDLAGKKCKIVDVTGNAVMYEWLEGISKGRTYTCAAPANEWSESYEYVGMEDEVKATAEDVKPDQPEIGQVWKWKGDGARVEIVAITTGGGLSRVYVVRDGSRKGPWRWGWFKENYDYVGKPNTDGQMEIPGAETPVEIPDGWRALVGTPKVLDVLFPVGSIHESRKKRQFGRKVKVVAWVQEKRSFNRAKHPSRRALVQNINPVKGQRKKTRLIRPKTLKRDYRRVE